MEWSIFTLFVVTTAIVIMVPGPAALTIAAIGAGSGPKRATIGIAGVATANAIYFALSATGIAALLIASHTVFSAIKWIGVAYLAYLGISAILGRAGGITITASPRQSAPTIFSKGFIVEFANPKALLYFAAILPQFLDMSRPILPQVLIMGGTTFVFDFIVYTGYAFLGHTLVVGGVKDWVLSLINKGAGGTLIFAGAKMATLTASS